MTSPEQQAWEAIVPENSRRSPAMAFVDEDPNLPRALLLGDSISVGYTVIVRETLAGKVNVWRAPENCRHTADGVKQLDIWLQDKDWDLIHFNFGLHDIKHVVDGQMNLDGPIQIESDDYRKNLNVIVDRLEKTGAKLIFATTTPVPEGAAGRRPEQCIEYNRIARDVMQQRDVQINDLYELVIDRLDECQKPQNVHFEPNGSELLGRRVAEVIEKALK